MCGILGGTNKDWQYREALKALKHRGPDDQGIIHNTELTLAFVRLSIIDLSMKGHQPMSSADQNVWITFNGEIYGFRELRKQLENKGHSFQSQTDTEVILNAYIEWGDEFINHIDGMFAIAIHDIKNNQLKLFRDRAGIKPLYYYHQNQNFAFGSELKSIVSLCHDVSFDYDYTAIYDYLSYMYIPEPKTMYKNVFKLLPAHKLIYDLNKKQILHNAPYWTLEIDPSPQPISLNEATEKLRSLINESVKQQLVADTPLGFFLSGGMDSSTIVAESVSLTDKIATFCIGFDDKENSETPYAQMVANKFETKHLEKILSNIQTDELLLKLKGWYDEPFADTSAFPTFLVSKVAREHVKVVLTGDGGDEIFGGYFWYDYLHKLSKNPFHNNNYLNKTLFQLKSIFPFGSFFYKMFNELETTTADDLTCLARLRGGMSQQEKKSYAEKWNIPKDYDDNWHFRNFYKPQLPIRTRLQYMDFFTYLPNDILTKVDRVSMAVSLEARVPLLSKEIIEFIFNVPEEIRYSNNQLKGLLKEAYRDVLPEEILNRKKRGFSIPKKYLNQYQQRKQEKILHELYPEILHS